MSGANAAVIAVLFRRARVDILNAFEQAEATIPGRAIPYTSGSGAERMVFARMRSAGAIRDDGGGRYHLDRAGLAAYEAGRGRLKAVLLAGVAVAAAALAAFG